MLAHGESVRRALAHGYRRSTGLPWVQVWVLWGVHDPVCWAPAQSRNGSVLQISVQLALYRFGCSKHNFWSKLALHQSNLSFLFSAQSSCDGLHWRVLPYLEQRLWAFFILAIAHGTVWPSHRILNELWPYRHTSLHWLHLSLCQVYLRTDRLSQWADDLIEHPELALHGTMPKRTICVYHRGKCG